MQTHASESVHVQLWEEQQAVYQEPEEEDKIHHVRLLDKLCQRVTLQTMALWQCGFSGVVGLPAEGRHRQGSDKQVPSLEDPTRSPYSNLTAQLES